MQVKNDDTGGTALLSLVCYSPVVFMLTPLLVFHESLRKWLLYPVHSQLDTLSHEVRM